MGRLLVVNMPDLIDDMMDIIGTNLNPPSKIMLSPETLDYIIELEREATQKLLDVEYTHFYGIEIQLSDRFPFGKYELLA